MHTHTLTLFSSKLAECIVLVNKLSILWYIQTLWWQHQERSRGTLRGMFNDRTLATGHLQGLQDYMFVHVCYYTVGLHFALSILSACRAQCLSLPACLIYLVFSRIDFTLFLSLSHTHKHTRTLSIFVLCFMTQLKLRARL